MLGFTNVSGNPAGAHQLQGTYCIASYTTVKLLVVKGHKKGVIFVIF